MDELVRITTFCSMMMMTILVLTDEVLSYHILMYGRSETLYLFCPDKLLYCVDNMLQVIIFTAWWKFLPMRLDAFLYKLLFLCIIDFTANKNKNLSRLPQFIADIAHSSTNYKWIKIHNVSYINAWKSVIAVSKSNNKKKDFRTIERKLWHGHSNSA